MDVERTFTIPTPASVVFDYLADFTHTDAWDPGTVRTTLAAGDGGVGTTYHNRSRFMGREVELDYETREHTPPTADRPGRLVFSGHDGKNTTATDDLTLTEVEGGAATEIRYRAEFHFSTLINLVAPLVVKPKLEKIADETVETMRGVLTALPH